MKKQTAQKMKRSKKKAKKEYIDKIYIDANGQKVITRIWLSDRIITAKDIENFAKEYPKLNSAKNEK